MKIIHFEDDKYLVLHKYNLISTFELEKQNDDTVRLAWFFIYEEFQGKHYSKKILRQIVNLIIKNDPVLKFTNSSLVKSNFLILQCYDNNIKAINLYESFGFTKKEGLGYTHIYKL